MTCPAAKRAKMHSVIEMERTERDEMRNNTEGMPYNARRAERQLYVHVRTGRHNFWGLA